jgi:hypothetical protein
MRAQVHYVDTALRPPYMQGYKNNFADNEEESYKILRTNMVPAWNEIKPDTGNIQTKQNKLRGP